MTHGRRAADKNYWTATGVIPRWQLVAVYGLMAVIGIVGFATIGNTADKASQASQSTRTLAQSTRALAQRAAAQAAESHRQALAIQQQRRDLCVDQNHRHDATIRQLDFIVRKIEHTAPPAERAQVKSSRVYNILLINALAPRRNCKAITTNP